jgi:hypothetical protein
MGQPADASVLVNTDEAFLATELRALCDRIALPGWLMSQYVIKFTKFSIYSNYSLLT